MNFSKAPSGETREEAIQDQSGSQFLTWRGLPLIPSDKVPVADGKSKILLLRVGEKRQGVVGLYQPGLAGEQSDDALAVLEDVEVGRYHAYPDTYR